MAGKLTLEEEVDSPPLTDEQLAKMRPAREVMPPEFFQAVKRYQGQRGPGKKSPKVLVSLRLEAATIEAFKAEGRGWQKRIGEVLDRAAKRKQRSHGST